MHVCVYDATNLSATRTISCVSENFLYMSCTYVFDFAYTIPSYRHIIIIAVAVAIAIAVFVAIAVSEFGSVQSNGTCAKAKISTSTGNNTQNTSFHQFGILHILVDGERWKCHTHSLTLHLKFQSVSQLASQALARCFWENGPLHIFAL